MVEELEMLWQKLKVTEKEEVSISLGVSVQEQQMRKERIA